MESMLEILKGGSFTSLTMPRVVHRSQMAGQMESPGL